MGITKIGPTGSVVWQKQLSNLGPSPAAFCRGVEVDSGGNLISVFYTTTPSNTTTIIKFDTSGNLLWQKSIPGNITFGAETFTLDSSDNIYVGSQNYTNSTNNIAKYDASGNFVWMKTITQSAATDGGKPFAMQFNSAGQLIVAATSATGSFSSGTANTVLWKINPSTGAILDSYAWVVNYYGSSNFGSVYGMGIDAYDNVYLMYAPDYNSYRFGLIKFSSTLSAGPVWSRLSFYPGPASYYLGLTYNGSMNVANNNIYIITGGGTATSKGNACLVMPTTGYLLGNRYITGNSPDQFGYLPNIDFTLPANPLTWSTSTVTVSPTTSTLTWVTPTYPSTAYTTAFGTEVKSQTYSAYSASLTAIPTTGLPADVDVSKLACDQGPNYPAMHAESWYFTVAPTTSRAIYRSSNFGAGYSSCYTAPAGQTVYDVIAYQAFYPSATYILALQVGTTSPYGPSVVFNQEAGAAGSTWYTTTMTDPTGNELSKAGAIAGNYANGISDGAGVETMVAIGSNAYTGGPKVYIMRSVAGGGTFSFTNVATLPSSSALTSSDQLSFAYLSTRSSSAICWMLRDKYYGISKSTDNGVTWTRVLSTSPTSYGFTSICQYAGTWVVTLQSVSSNASTMGYYYSTDLGNNWTFVQYPNAMASPPSGSGVTYDTAYANFTYDYITGVPNLVIHVTATGAGATNASAVFISTDKGVSISNTMSVGGSGVTSVPAGAVGAYGPAIGPTTTNVIRPLNPAFSYSTYNVGASGQNFARAIALDSSDNAYVGGTNGTVAKFNSTGTPQTGFSLARSTFNLDISSIKVDSSNNIYVAGSYNTGAATNPALVKLDSSGTILWQKYLNVPAHSASAASTVNIDSSNNIYFTAPCLTGGFNYTYVIKFNSSGTVLWQNRISAGPVLSYSAMDSSGNLYLCGYDTSSTGVLMKISTAGAITWQRKITSAGYTSYLYGITCTADIGQGQQIVVMGESSNPTYANKTLVYRYNTSGVIGVQFYLGLYTGATTYSGVLAPPIQLAADYAGNAFLPYYSPTTGAHSIANLQYPLYTSINPAAIGPIGGISGTTATNAVLAINGYGNLYCATTKCSTGSTYYDMLAVMSPAMYPVGQYNTGAVTFESALKSTSNGSSAAMTDAAGTYTIAANADPIVAGTLTKTAYTPTVVITPA